MPVCPKYGYIQISQGNSHWNKFKFERRNCADHTCDQFLHASSAVLSPVLYFWCRIAISGSRDTRTFTSCRTHTPTWTGCSPSTSTTTGVYPSLLPLVLVYCTLGVQVLPRIQVGSRQGVRHGFKIGGAKASKLLKMYCKF